ncbi:MAG: hypothetical protein ACRDY4_14245 [Acidimicrobiia bacterium]
MDIFVLAQEHLTEKTLWNPTILGVLVVVAGIVLFCGSIYLLLGTNLGARLGFLIAFTGLMGFMVVLTIMWMTTSSPLNTIKGRVPAWEVQEIVPDLGDAKTEEARDIVEQGRKVDAPEAANVKAAVDATIVPGDEAATEEAGGGSDEFVQFEVVTEYLILETYEIGGGKPNPLDFEFTHDPLIAAAQYCEVVDVEVPFGLPPPEPECDPESEKQGFIVLERDLGSLRVPPVVAFGMFSVLFGLGLLALHWRERDEIALQAAGTAPVPVQS